MICYLCQKEFKFLGTHLKDTHKKDPEQAYLEFTKIAKPLCFCGCRNETNFISFERGFTKYISGHNIHMIHTKEMFKKAAQARAGGTSWNKGLTKENDEKVKLMSIKIGESGRKKWKNEIHPRKGQTKETNVSLAKSSETKKRKYASGEIVSWNLGQTKETSQKLKTISENIKKRIALDGHHRARSHDEACKILKDSGLFEVCDDSEKYKTKYTRLSVKCAKCNGISLKSLHSFRGTKRCMLCRPRESAGQLAVLEYVKSLGFNAISSDRSIITPYELDIIIPERKIAIEYNGLYYHSFKCNKDKNYHIRKREACEEKQYELLSIFEDEWTHSRLSCEANIKRKLMLLDVKRAVTFIECYIDDMSEIVSLNHQVNLGLYDRTFKLFDEDDVFIGVCLISTLNDFVLLDVVQLNKFTISNKF